MGSPRAPAPSRPIWMLLAIALPLGVLVNGLTGGWDNLPGALLVLAGWEHEPNLWQRWVVKTLSNLAIPGLLAFCVLKFTRLGRWLVPNRLAIAAVLGADALLCAYAAWSLTIAGMGGMPFLTGVASSLMGGALACCFVVGLGSLALSTVWHRLVRDKATAMDKIGGLLRGF